MSAIVKQPTRAVQVTFIGSSTDFFEPSLLYVGVGGNVNVVLESGSQIIFYGVPSGTILPFKCIRILLNGTSVATRPSIIRLF